MARNHNAEFLLIIAFAFLLLFWCDFYKALLTGDPSATFFGQHTGKAIVGFVASIFAIALSFSVALIVVAAKDEDTADTAVVIFLKEKKWIKKMYV